MLLTLLTKAPARTPLGVSRMRMRMRGVPWRKSLVVLVARIVLLVVCMRMRMRGVTWRKSLVVYEALSY